METKLKSVQDDFYAFSSKASEITRQLAFAGIAIIWIFKTDSAGHIELSKDLIGILQLLVICLALDFLHAAIPSIVYGFLDMYFRNNKKKKDEDSVKYSMVLTFPEWILFVSKIVFLVWAYYELWMLLKDKLI